MIGNKKILAVITAREGSKRLPNKNILELYGKPLIVWTIDAAKESRYLDKIIVSTDSSLIKEVSEKYEVEVPFYRPKYLATDLAKSIAVIKHAIEFYKDQFDYIILLQPTSPLRNTIDIDRAIELLNTDTKAVISVCKTEHSPLWSNTLPNDHSMGNFIKEEVKNTRSQDLPIYYRLNGAIYIADINYFYNSNGFIGKQTKAYVMSTENSIDIDTELDFLVAETVLKRNIG